MLLEGNLNFEFIIHFLDGIQQLLGNKCEIIVHDFRNGYENSIVHAVNSKLSGRDVGGKPRGALIMNLGKDIEPIKKSKVLFYKGEKGQMFKSCSTLLADIDNKVVGSICLNIEVSEMMAASSIMSEFLSPPSAKENISDSSSIMAQNVDDVLEHYILSCEELIGKPMELMSKGEKVKALQYLDKRGVFKISKANILLCDRFQISKYSLYNYLDEARNMIEVTQT